MICIFIVSLVFTYALGLLGCRIIDEVIYKTNERQPVALGQYAKLRNDIPELNSICNRKKVTVIRASKNFIIYSDEGKINKMRTGKFLCEYEKID